VHNGLQHIIHAHAGLRAHGDCVGCIQANSLLNGLLRAQNVSRRQVDLVDDGNNFQAVIDGRYAFARVCASTPWLASTTSSAPSQEASDRETS